MKITKIERQETNPKRVNIFCDDQFAYGVHEDVLVRFGLRKGDVVDGKLAAELERAEEFNQAKVAALKFASHRQRSEKEVRLKLTEKEFAPAVIDEVVAHLEKHRILDDEAFARAFVNDQLMKKSAGVKLLRQRLRLKGISKPIIEKVLGETLGVETEIALAREAAAKQLRRLEISSKKLPREKKLKRLADFLSRRGFTWDTVSTVIKELFPHSPSN
jgi:regulatory protein